MEAYATRTTHLDTTGYQAIICNRFFLLYRLGQRDQSDNQDGGSVEGGHTPWGEISGTIKNIGLSPQYILWGTGWQNIVLMSADMPYWKADFKPATKSKKRLPEKLEGKNDFNDFLNS